MVLRSARWHELRVLAGANPALPVLLVAGGLARPIRRVPRLGWVVADPVTARQILNDPAHFTLLGEGGVGHLWAQVLGDWVYDVFDGAGHHALRSRTRELFTDESAQALVARVVGPRLAAFRQDLEDGKIVDVADLARVIVGRIVTDLLGLDANGAVGTGGSGEEDETYRRIFATGEELAALALGTTTSTVLEPSTVARAKAIVARMTGHVAHAYRTAPPERLLGRCRELGVEPRHAEGLATLLMVAGTETAASAMARIVALLHDTGEQDRLRAEPERLPDAVREGLRVTTPAPLIGRSISADVTIAGRQLRRGERVLMLTWTANNFAPPSLRSSLRDTFARDFGARWRSLLTLAPDARYDARSKAGRSRADGPGGFALDRPYLPENRQLWFGAGRHLCLGAPLARAEIAALLRTIITAGRHVQRSSRSGRGGHFRVVDRAVRRRVLIPSYEHLRIQLVK